MKQLVIDPQKKLFLLQEEFNQLFPYLKIDFISIINKPNGMFQHLIKRYNHTLNEFRSLQSDTIISILPTMSVLEFDSQMRQNFGLGILVYRKSGKLWLETTLTDDWTLEEQNWQGEALSIKG
ncbi:MAG: hypothetical protein PSX81_08855 [bacterium]|nr:hypothetical protein [bacterium]